MTLGKITVNAPDPKFRVALVQRKGQEHNIIASSMSMKRLFRRRAYHSLAQDIWR